MVPQSVSFHVASKSGTVSEPLPEPWLLQSLIDGWHADDRSFRGVTLTEILGVVARCILASLPPIVVFRSNQAFIMRRTPGSPLETLVGRKVINPVPEPWQTLTHADTHTQTGLQAPGKVSEPETWRGRHIHAGPGSRGKSAAIPSPLPSKLG